MTRLRLVALALIPLTLTAATTRECAHEAGGGNPAPITDSIALHFQARGTPHRARIYLRTINRNGRPTVHIDANRRLPWNRTLRIQPTESIEFMVGVERSDNPEIVTCQISNPGSDDPIEIETAHGRNPSAVCLLAPLTDRLKG